MSKCTACGDKPENTAKDFTKAVIEINNPETLVLLRKVVIPASMGDDTDVVPAVGKYRNVILQYEANGHIYLYSSDGIPTAIETSIPQEVLDRIAELETDTGLLETSLAVETDARERADQGLQQEIDELKNSPDVVDIVATYADLQAYDTSTLGDKDVIRVLEDETHNNESAYYRWDKTNSQWVFIGAVEGYYTKDQTDDLLDAKQDLLTPGENITIEDESGALVISATDTKYTAGSNVQISPQNVISATDTTYTHFTGTDGTTAGAAGLVPAPATTDAGKFLSASGIWEVVQSASGVTELAEGNTVIGNNPALAFWLLEPGIYTFNKTSSENTKIQLTNAYSIGWWSNSMTGLAVVSEPTSSTKYVLFLQDVWAGFPIKISYTDSTTGQGSYKMVSPVDNLNSSDNSLPLAATQGKALKNLIGDLTNLTTTDKTNLVAAINEVVSGGSGPTVVQTAGTSTTDVMSQNATTSMVFADPGTSRRVKIGDGAESTHSGAISIGWNAKGKYSDAIAIGDGAESLDNHSVSLGRSAKCPGGYQVALGSQAGANTSASLTNTVALGSYSKATRTGEVNVGVPNYQGHGYNNTNYRVIGGVHDGQEAHDAVTKGQLDSAVNTLETELDAKQDMLTAGQNITIAEESGALVISATGGSGADVFTTNEWNALWA